MTDVENTKNGQLTSARSVEFRVAAELENLAVLRTLVGAVGTFEDLDFDAVADLRLAVDEACTRLIKSAVPDSTLVLVVRPQDDAVVIEASTTCNIRRHPGARQLQLARAEFADRRGAHLPGRSGARRGAGVRDRHDDETSEFTAVTPSSAKSSSSRSNSEYADVADLFRELSDLPEDSAQFQRQRDRIVERCLPLADHIARRFDGRGEPRDDLVQVARVGLVNAVIRFDVDAGSDFVSFAVPTIMGEVRRHFRDNSWSVKVPRRLKELHLRLGAATADLSQRLGRAPTASELAAELDMDRDEVVEGLVAGSSYNTLSIDSGGSGNEDAPGHRRHARRSSTSASTRSRTGKRCGRCSLRYRSGSGPYWCSGSSSR